jgi:hypothetical protein
MTDKRTIQKILFIFLFINCCLIVIFTAFSLSTDQWVIVRPIRKVFYNSSPKQSNFIFDSTLDYNKESLPVDLHARKGCERFNGKIK